MEDSKKRVEEQNVKQANRDEKLDGNSKQNLDRKLDEANEESFPASDPVSVKITK